MRTMQRGRALAALLALLVAMAGLPGPARAQDERPDLKIEIVGVDPADPTKVQVRVTNVGKWWADHTTATVETTAPTRGNKQEEDVLDLDPKQEPQGPTDYKYEFTYRLAAACQPGLKVKASLSTAVTFDGNNEAAADLANNVDEREPCPAAAQAGPAVKLEPPLCTDPIAVFTDRCRPSPDNPGTISLGETKRRGAHQLGLHGAGGEFPPEDLPESAVKSVHKVTTGFLEAPAFLGYTVGWYQHEGGVGLFDNNSSVVAQTAVRFDLAKLDEIPADKLELVAAMLRFEEHPLAWTNADGDPEHKPLGCVAVLGIATTDWTAGPATSLFPNNYLSDSTASAREWFPQYGVFRHRWNVTDHVKKQLARPQDPSLRFGYVLRGGLEQVDADDDTSCMSRISISGFEVTYRVRP